MGSQVPAEVVARILFALRRFTWDPGTRQAEGKHPAVVDRWNGGLIPNHNHTIPWIVDPLEHFQRVLLISATPHLTSLSLTLDIFWNSCKLSIVLEHSRAGDCMQRTSNTLYWATSYYKCIISIETRLIYTMKEAMTARRKHIVR